MTPRQSVGVSLITSAETEATVDLIRDEVPDARISNRDCFYKIERDGILEFDMKKLSDRLGRRLDVEGFLVNMSSYYGRIVVSDDLIQIFSDIKPERFRD